MGLGTKGEGTEKHRLVVTKQSRGYKVQHREYTQYYSINYAQCQMGPRNTRENAL